MRTAKRAFGDISLERKSENLAGLQKGESTG